MAAARWGMLCIAGTASKVVLVCFEVAHLEEVVTTTVTIDCVQPIKARPLRDWRSDID